jgi:hypothetical protein
MSNYCKDKKIDSIVTKLVKSSNWKYELRKKHGRITAPTGKFAIVPKTPSDFRASMNFKCEIFRIDQSLRGLI